jgi:hypothetical protein
MTHASHTHTAPEVRLPPSSYEDFERLGFDPYMADVLAATVRIHRDYEGQPFPLTPDEHDMEVNLRIRRRRQHSKPDVELAVTFDQARQRILGAGINGAIPRTDILRIIFGMEPLME